MGLEGPGAEPWVQGLPVPADLPVLEERPRGGEALEGHDRPSPAGGGAVAPAESLSTPGLRGRGSPFPAPVTPPQGPRRGAEGSAGQRSGSRGPCGRRGTEPPSPPLLPLPGAGAWGARSRPGPPAQKGARSDDPPPIPIPIPTTGQDFCECFQPRSLGAPLPLPSLPPRHFRGPGCRCKRDPQLPSPFSSIKPLRAVSVARAGPQSPPPCPASSPPPSPSPPAVLGWHGAGGTQEERAAPFPGPRRGLLGSEAMTQFVSQSRLICALPSAGFDALLPSWGSVGAGG